jgi:hypothetical protein
MLAMVVNDNAASLTPRGVCEIFASMLASTGKRVNATRNPARSRQKSPTRPNGCARTP